MPNTASASLFPWMWAIPQSSRTISTREASARQRPISGGAPTVRRKSAGRRDLRIRQCLLGLAPACKRFGRRTLDQLVGIANAEMVPAVIFVELVPGDRRGHRRAFAGARGIRHDRGRSALV